MFGEQTKVSAIKLHFHACCLQQWVAETATYISTNSFQRVVMCMFEEVELETALSATRFKRCSVGSPTYANASEAFQVRSYIGP